jgi:glycosyltransferase involved in cell wall biosynthesis
VAGVTAKKASEEYAGENLEHSMNLYAYSSECTERRMDAPSRESRKLARQETVASPVVYEERVHLLYIIDQICHMGGAEHVLLEIVRRLSPDRFSWSIVTFRSNPALEGLKDLPCRLQVLPLARTYDVNAVRMALRLGRLIRNEKPSIVHTFFETSDLWAAPIAKVSGCPILISSRRDMGILRTRKHHLAYPFVNRIFDRILAVSEEVRSYCIQQDHLSPQRVETLYNGVDMAVLDNMAADGDARQKLGLQTDAPVISALANIRSIKGIDVLVRAAKRVCIEFPEAQFLVVGRVLEPPTMSDLRAQVGSLQLADNFRFVGELANPFPVLRATNVFCLPSRNEGFSNALIEAMGCGLPCVATRVGGNAEALEEGKSGYLVGSEDADAMADRILRLLRDPVSARRMGETARETVRARFSMDVMINRLMGIYDELLAAKHA